MTTILDALAARLASAIVHNHATERPPVVVLWPDGERKWQSALPTLRRGLPNLWTLGAFDAAIDQGPAPWVKWRLGQLPETDPVPVLYLPGVSHSQFRSLEDFPDDLKPIAELQFRGVWWVQANYRDWTPLALLSAKRGGMGLTVAQDAHTTTSLDRLVSRVLETPLAQLQKPSRLEAEHFVALLTQDLEGDLLDWLDDNDKTVSTYTPDEWAVFRDDVLAKLDVDLDRDGPIVVAEQLIQQRAGWAKVWTRYASAVPTSYGMIHRVLERAAPVLLADMSTQPRHNDQQEEALRLAFAELAGLPEVEARRRVRSLESKHGQRRSWVWAKLGRARLASVLGHLTDLADATEGPVGGSSQDALASWYAGHGHKADRAALAALGLADHTHGAVIHGAVRALYLPWLQRSAQCLRDLVEASGYPQPEAVPVEDGTCLLFADGLRWDVGAALVDRLVDKGHRVDSVGRWVAFPPVTTTSKADVSPIRDQLTGGSGASTFTPSVAATGKVLDSATFNGLMVAQGVQMLGGNETGNPTGRAWTEFGDIDKYGHKHGCKTARHVHEQLRELEQRIDELLDAGWKRVRVTTDHGWLLVPGGLPQLALPGWLTDARWQRCALAKATSQVDLPSIPWAWDPNVSVAFPPGVDGFSIQTGNSREYAHGGLTMQECYTPVLTVALDRPAVDGTLGELKWVGLRCKTTVQTTASGLLLDLRTKVADTSSSVLDAPKAVGAKGTVSVLVPDDRREGTAAFAVLLAPDGRVLDKRSTTIGGDA